jgi:hypothetical protein
MSPSIQSEMVSVTLEKMRRACLSIAVLGLCSFASVLLFSDDSWARPKKTGTYWACKCACRWVDAQGQEHFGPSGAVQFTESTLERCLGHACTTGGHQGTTRDCMGTEQQSQMRLPPGGVQGQLQQVPPASGPMSVPVPGQIMRRGVEGDQPTSSEKEGK